MSEEESAKFLKAACDAFPGLADLSVASPATPAVWVRTLSKVSYVDATAVLDGWIDGSLKDPPVGFRRELFALDVRSCAQVIREARSKTKRYEEDFKKSHRRKTQSDLMSIQIGPIYARICAVIELRNKGGLTPDEAYDETSRIVEEGLKMLEMKVPA